MKQIGTEFGGWPIYKHTLREILLDLGGKENENGDIVFSADSSCLDIYPRTLEDDGMGYGVNEKFITEASVGDDYINIFVESVQKEFIEK